MQHYYELANACANCATRVEFDTLVRTWVRKILPHGPLAAAIGRIDLDHLKICCFISVDYPEAALAQLPMTFNLRERPVVQRWLQLREPLVLQLPTDSAAMSDRERYEIESFSLGRLAVHGVLDMSAKTGSYFSFGRVPVDLGTDVVCAKLKLVTPPLHQALMNVYLKERATEAAPLASLSPTEFELLRWVAAGRTNNEIAQLRQRSPATIRNQIHSAFTKLGVKTRAEAARVVLREGGL